MIKNIKRFKIVIIYVKKKIRRNNLNLNINLPENIPFLLRKIYANRGISSAEELDFSLKGMLSWTQLNGVEKATKILYEAFIEGKTIIVIGDFDVDGATSIALIVLSLRALGYNNVDYIVPNRFEDGYGLNKKIVHKAHARGAQIIITVDNGISSNLGVELANSLGISVIITDHHLPGINLPKAAAIINPNLPNCNFQSKYLAGVGVAFYLMLALCSFMNEMNKLNYKSIIMPKLTEYLDLVALGTVADLVPLDKNNRILTWQGIIRIRAGKCRPGIKALLEISNRNNKRISTSDLGFILSPRLNSAGRLEDMSIGVALLLCENINEARILAYKLDKINNTRKYIEQCMQAEALELCKKLKFNNNGALPYGLVIYNHKWHQGIVGILASRIKERFNRPVIAFAPTNNKTLKGSGRSIKGLHMRDVLEYLNLLYPKLIIQFGGHAMAVGLLLKNDNFEKFKKCFSELIINFIDSDILFDEIISDGELTPKEMTIEVAQMLHDAGPWGQMFQEPLFDGHFSILKQNLVGGHHLKVVVKPINGGPLLDGIVFNVDQSIWPDNSVTKVEVVYKLYINEFRGNCKLQIIINNIWPI